MRAVLALALTLSALALSGCVADATDGASSSRDCSAATDEAVARTADVLLPADVPSERPHVSVHARAGQTVTAAAVWRADAGEAKADFNGPSQHEVQAGTTWSATTPNAPEGDYALSLAGAPFAMGLSYTLVLVANGCTPAA